MPRVRRHAFGALLCALACQVEHEEVVGPEDSVFEVPESPTPPAADEQTGVAAEETPSPPQTIPDEDELLVLDTVHCHVTGTQELVDCEHDWEALLRTKATPAWALCRLRPDDIRDQAPKPNELWRGKFAVGDESGQRLEPWCEVERVDARVGADEHGIEALSDNMLHGVALGAKIDELQGAPDLEKGPVRAVVGTRSERVRFASVYLSELGEWLAIPGEKLLRREELRAALDAKFESEWPTSRMRRSDLFAPQVKDAAQRAAFGRTPKLSTCDVPFSEWPRPWAFAVPVMAEGRRRYLVMATTLMRSPNENALGRRMLIERIVEDGVEPCSASLYTP